MTSPLYPCLLFMTRVPCAALSHVAEASIRSIHSRPATAFLVLLPRPTGAQLISPDLGGSAPRPRRESRARVNFSMLPEIPIGSQESRRHVHDDLFPLLPADRFSPQLRILVVLVAEHHHRDQASAVLLVID